MERDAVLALMSESFGRKLLTLIAQAYRVRAQMHRPDIGDNATTFGMNVRFSIEKFLEDELMTIREVHISRPVGSFQIAYAGHIFHFYKFGMTINDRVDQLTFDDSSTKINLVVDNQLALPGFPNFKHWVIAHSGNPTQGLVEVYIGAPHTLGGGGSPWAWRHRIFMNESAQRDLSLSAAHANEFADVAALKIDVLKMQLHHVDKVLLPDVF